MDTAERDRMRAAYRAGLSEIQGERDWTLLDRLPTAQAPGLIITAWNPFSRRLPTTVNAARDHVEEGWLIPHAAERSLRLLRRYEQAAGYLISPDGRRLLWHDGVEEGL